MRLPVDDEIYNVNAVWLGPPGKTLPFRARYIRASRARLLRPSWSGCFTAPAHSGCRPP